MNEASDPQTCKQRLSFLARVFPGEVAANPNASADTLKALIKRYPHEVFNNAAAFMLDLEDPSHRIRHRAWLEIACNAAPADIRQALHDGNGNGNGYGNGDGDGYGNGNGNGDGDGYDDGDGNGNGNGNGYGNGNGNGDGYGDGDGDADGNGDGDGNGYGYGRNIIIQGGVMEGNWWLARDESGFSWAGRSPDGPEGNFIRFEEVYHVVFVSGTHRGWLGFALAGPDQNARVKRGAGEMRVFGLRWVTRISPDAIEAIRAQPWAP